MAGRKHIIRSAFAAAIALAAGRAEAQDVRIAVAGPMTGQYAAFGEQLRRGAEMAVADINAKGGVLGRKLVMEIGDDACDPKQAVAVANQLASRNVQFVAGHFCSSSSIPASAVYAEAGILQITQSSTNPALTDDAAAKGWWHIFRACGRDDQQTAIAAEYILDKFKGRNVAIVHDKTQGGRGVADQVKKAINAKGLKEVMFDSVTQGDREFSPLITKMKQAQIDIIYYGGYHTEAALIVRQARQQGLAANLIGPDSLATEEFWGITGPSGEGSMMTFPPDPRRAPEAKEVVARFKAQGYEPEGYTLYSYAALQLFAGGAERAKSLDNKEIAKALRSAENNTVIGTIGYDAKGDIVQPQFILYRWSGGKYEPL